MVGGTMRCLAEDCCIMIPHCIMYEGICILYLAELAVVGRNSLYLLFIAVAVWPRTLNRTLPPPHQQLSSGAAAGISSLSSAGNKEKTMGWWQWIPRVWNYIQRQRQTKKIKLNLSTQQTGGDVRLHCTQHLTEIWSCGIVRLK